MNNNSHLVQSMGSVPSQVIPPIVLEVPYKTGKVRITGNGMLALFVGFSKTPAWQASCDSVKKFTAQPWGFGFNILIHTTNGTQLIEMVSKANLEKLCALFPAAQRIAAPRGGALWYVDIRKRTYVATYVKQKIMQREMEKASQHGWMPQTSAGISGHRIWEQSLLAGFSWVL